MGDTKEGGGVDSNCHLDEAIRETIRATRLSGRKGSRAKVTPLDKRKTKNGNLSLEKGVRVVRPRYSAAEDPSPELGTIVENMKKMTRLLKSTTTKTTSASTTLTTSTAIPSNRLISFLGLGNDDNGNHDETRPRACVTDIDGIAFRTKNGSDSNWPPLDEYASDFAALRNAAATTHKKAVQRENMATHSWVEKYVSSSFCNACDSRCVEFVIVIVICAVYDYTMIVLLLVCLIAYILSSLFDTYIHDGCMTDLFVYLNAQKIQNLEL